MSALAPTLEAFFTSRLINEKGASPNTIAAYRVTFRLLWASRPSEPARHPANSTSQTSTLP